MNSFICFSNQDDKNSQITQLLKLFFLRNMKTSYKIIATIVAVLSLSTVAVADANAKSHQKKHHVSKAKKAHKSKKNKAQKQSKKESAKPETAKPVENNGGGEMKTRLIDAHQ
ncbi:MAG: hypothetical protein V4694_05355 [Pseudomonadota bacterium]